MYSGTFLHGGVQYVLRPPRLQSQSQPQPQRGPFMSVVLCSLVCCCSDVSFASAILASASLVGPYQVRYLLLVHSNIEPSTLCSSCVCVKFWWLVFSGNGTCETWWYGQALRGAHMTPVPHYPRDCSRLGQYVDPRGAQQRNLHISFAPPTACLFW